MIKICTLFSGSSGNSIFIGKNNTKLLIDAGVSAKRIINALYSIGENPSELSAILITHEHNDHIKGAGILSRRFGIPIYANENTWQVIEKLIGPVDVCNKKFFYTEKNFEIGNTNVLPFNIPHDAVDPVGFNIFIKNKKVTTATDIGHINAKVIKNIEKSDFVLLESNHDVEMLKVGPYPFFLKQRIMGEKGHLSNEMAAKTVVHLVKKGTTKFLLGHLSHKNNFPELAYQTVFSELHRNEIKIGRDILLDIALRNEAGKIIEV